MKRRTAFAVIALLVLGGVAWGVAQRRLGPTVTGYAVTSQPLVQTVVATGRVTAVSRAQVGTPVTGVVVERRVREGDRVRPGDILAILRADDLEATVREARAALEALQQSTRPQAQAALREAEASLAQAIREAQRRRELFQQRAISREDMERAIQTETVARAATEQARLAARALTAGQPDEAVARARLASAEAQLAKTTIRSEVSGIVLTRNAEPGNLAQPGQVLFEIARDGNTEILVPVDEKNLGVLALGQAAMCVADAYPARPFPATVTFIAPSVDAQRGTVDIRLTVDPVPDFLRQDMTVSVNVESGRRDRAIVVPNDALMAVQGDRAQLWVIDNGHATRREVRLGLRSMAQTEVTSGLTPGDLVLTDSLLTLTEGTPVRVRTHEGAPPEAEASHASRNESPIGFN